MVEDERLIPSQHGVTISTAVVLLRVVPAAKVSFEDWSTAWTVETAFIGMVALAMKISITS
jgi:hypothetical protein